MGGGREYSKNGEGRGWVIAFFIFGALNSIHFFFQIIIFHFIASPIFYSFNATTQSVKCLWVVLLFSPFLYFPSQSCIIPSKSPSNTPLVYRQLCNWTHGAGTDSWIAKRVGRHSSNHRTAPKNFKKTLIWMRFITEIR